MSLNPNCVHLLVKFRKIFDMGKLSDEIQSRDSEHILGSPWWRGEEGGSFGSVEKQLFGSECTVHHILGKGNLVPELFYCLLKETVLQGRSVILGRIQSLESHTSQPFILRSLSIPDTYLLVNHFILSYLVHCSQTATISTPRLNSKRVSETIECMQGVAHT